MINNKTKKEASRQWLLVLGLAFVMSLATASQTFAATPDHPQDSGGHGSGRSSMDYNNDNWWGDNMMRDWGSGMMGNGGGMMHDWNNDGCNCSPNDQKSTNIKNDFLKKLDQDSEFRKNFTSRLNNDSDFRDKFLSKIRGEGRIGEMFADRFDNDSNFRQKMLDRFNNDNNFRDMILRRLDSLNSNWR